MNSQLHGKYENRFFDRLSALWRRTKKEDSFNAISVTDTYAFGDTSQDRQDVSARGLEEHEIRYLEEGEPSMLPSLVPTSRLSSEEACYTYQHVFKTSAVQTFGDESRRKRPDWLLTSLVLIHLF